MLCAQEEENTSQVRVVSRSHKERRKQNKPLHWSKKIRTTREAPPI
jgi:hypothetical protein